MLSARSRYSLIPHPMNACNAAPQALMYTICSPQAIGSLRDPNPNHVPYLGSELLQAERLGQEIDVAVAAKTLAERILRITGNEDHLHLGVNLSHFADERGSVH